MKKLVVVIALVLAISPVNARMFSLQDQDAAERAREEAASIAAEKARIEAREAANDKARDNFINGLRNQSDTNLTAAESKAREAKRKENEIRFAALQESARELTEISARTYKEINANGSQTLSLTIYKDVERMEQLVKEMRRNIK
jgi:hypothetical protein